MVKQPRHCRSSWCRDRYWDVRTGRSESHHSGQALVRRRASRPFARSIATRFVGVYAAGPRHTRRIPSRRGSSARRADRSGNGTQRARRCVRPRTLFWSHIEHHAPRRWSCGATARRVSLVRIRHAHQGNRARRGPPQRSAPRRYGAVPVPGSRPPVRPSGSCTEQAFAAGQHELGLPQLLQMP